MRPAPRVSVRGGHTHDYIAPLAVHRLASLWF